MTIAKITTSKNIFCYTHALTCRRCCDIYCNWHKPGARQNPAREKRTPALRHPPKPKQKLPYYRSERFLYIVNFTTEIGIFFLTWRYVGVQSL